MIFSIVQDFADVLNAMPQEHPRYRILKLLDEAIRRDVHFIDRHPTTFFQCMWNTCWWYDQTDQDNTLQASPSAKPHKQATPVASGACEATANLTQILTCWRTTRERSRASPPWMRSLRPPPVGLGQGLFAVLPEHTAAITALAFSPSGRLLATGDANGAIQVIELPNLKTFIARKIMGGRIIHLAFSEDEETVCATSADGEIVLANAITGEQQLFLSRPSALFSFVGSGDDGFVCFVSDVSNGFAYYRQDFHTGAVATIQERSLENSNWKHWHGTKWNVSADGSRFAANQIDASGCGVGVFQTMSGHHHTVSRARSVAAACIALSRKGTRLAVARGPSATGLPTGTVSPTRGVPFPHVIQVIDTTNTRLLYTVRVKFTVVTMAISSDGSAGVCAGVIGGGGFNSSMRPQGVSPSDAANRGLGTENLYFWNSDSPHRLDSVSGHTMAITCMAWSPDDKWVASGSEDRTVHLWTVNRNARAHHNVDHRTPITCLSHSREAGLFASGASDWTVRIWDDKTGRWRSTVKHVMPPERIEISPDGERLVTVAGSTAFLWNASLGRLLCIIPHLLITIVRFSDDGKLLLVHTGLVTTVWSARSGRRLGRTSWNLGFPVATSSGYSVDNPDHIQSQVFDCETLVAACPEYLAPCLMLGDATIAAGAGCHFRLFILEGIDPGPAAVPQTRRAEINSGQVLSSLVKFRWTFPAWSEAGATLGVIAYCFFMGLLLSLAGSLLPKHSIILSLLLGLAGAFFVPVVILGFVGMLRMHLAVFRYGSWVPFDSASINAQNDSVLDTVVAHVFGAHHRSIYDSGPYGLIAVVIIQMVSAWFCFKYWWIFFSLQVGVIFWPGLFIVLGLTLRSLYLADKRLKDCS